MIRGNFLIGLLLLFMLSLVGCSSYKQNIMFKAPEDLAYKFTTPFNSKGAYTIQHGDQLNVDVYTNEGEYLIDPNKELKAQGQTVNANVKPIYIVSDSGYLRLPLIGDIYVKNLTLRMAEDSLAQRFSKQYEKPFVKITFLNKRVSVLGATGGVVVPLQQENMRLTEILSIATGLPNDSKAMNIRVLRGNEVFIADLSTIEGYQKNNIIIEPNDIIYVEPVRRSVIETSRDVVPFVSVISGLTALLVILFR